MENPRAVTQNEKIKYHSFTLEHFQSSLIVISYTTHMGLCGEIALKGNTPFSALSQQTIESTCCISKVVLLSSGSSEYI